MISKNGGSHKKTLTSPPKANPSKAQSGFTCFHHQNSAFLGCFIPKQSESHSAVLGTVQKKLDHPRNRGLIHQGYQPLRLPQKNSNDSLFRCPKDSVVDFQQNIIGKIGKDHVPISQYSNFPVFCFHWEKNHQQIQLDQRTHFFFGSEVQRSTYQGS